jgi:maintenance of morphology protein 1
MDSKSVEDAVQLANGEFIKGFIAGQFILCILIFFLLKVFLLRNSTETRESLTRKTKSFILPKVGQIKQVRSMTVQQKHAIDSVILTKLKYDTTTHPNESCDWINVLLAQFISTLRNDTSILNGLADKVGLLMNKENQKSGFIGPITITDFHLGDEFPELKNARVRFSDQDGNMRVLIDFSFDDQIKIALDTQALVNWPKPGMASLPISLSFTLVKFSGTVFESYIVCH